MKGVFLLGLIVCWTVLCSGAEGYHLSDSDRNEDLDVSEDDLPSLLEKEYLFFAPQQTETGKPCGDEDVECDPGTICIDKVCVEEVCSDKKPCESEDELCDKNKCRKKCNEEKGCKNGGECKGEGEKRICECLSGLSGDFCDTIDACSTESFKYCKEANGTCSYNVENNEAFCDCPPGKDLHPDNVCKEKCSDVKVCKHDGICEGENDIKFCKCKKSLSGDFCDIINGCTTGIFKDCKDDYGTCSYDVSKEAAVCSCPAGKELHPKDNKCKECDCGKNGKCEFDVDGQKKCVCKEKFAEKQGICVEKCTDVKVCKHDGTCEGTGDIKFCKCKKSLSGDFCDIINGCTTGIFKDCKGDYGMCSYDVSKEAAVCSCPAEKKLHPKDNKCKECDCGKNGKCKFDEDGQKKCVCEEKFAEKEGICVECDCGPKGICSYKEDIKTCACETSYGEKDGKCREMCTENKNCGYDGKCVEEEGKKFCQCETGISGDKCEIVDACATGKFWYCKDDNGTCSYDAEKKEAVCKCPPGKVLHPDNVCKECDCGDKGTCTFETGKKKCNCIANYAENNGICAEIECNDDGKDCAKGKKCFKNFCKVCDCGENGTCRFDNDGNKKCDCQPKFQEKKGTCEECFCGDKGVCSFDKDGNKKCVCEETYTEKQGLCTECDCGKNGVCQFNSRGNKECICHPKFEVKGGICEDCNCGDEGKCSFDDSGKKKCVCNPKFSVKEGICTACNCGTRGKCSFDEDGDKQCTCDKTYANKDGTCEKCDCGDGGTCSFVEGKKTCHCNDTHKLFNNDKCIECDCGEKGDCELSDKGIKTCKCGGGTAEKRGKCVETCSDDCENGAKCKEFNGKKFCDCKTGLLGDKCEIIKECLETGKYKDCQESGGICEFVNNKAFCNCTEKEQKLDDTLNVCRKMCEKNAECENGGTCVNKLCACNPGTSGDTCDVIDCSQLKCTEIGAKCVYDKDNKRATCECKKDYVYKNNECVAEWCLTNCKADKSKCEWKNGTGICTCPKPEERYDYSDDTCKGIDKCLLELKCKADQICKNNECVCKPNYVLKKDGEKETCERKNFCDTKPCFDGANCTEGSVPGKVRCFCAAANSFYNPKTGKCEDGSCFLPGQKGNCKECPTGMEFKDNTCKPRGEKTSCDKDCGPGGWCINNADGKPECSCLQKYTKKEGDICVLKAAEVCPDGKFLKDDKNKCNCTDTYKNADNGVTCEKRSCLDDDVQKASKGAICEDNWKSKTVFKFSCSTGYTFNAKDGCLDRCQLKDAKSSCSKLGQTCYLGENSILECRCPPTFGLSVSGVEKTCDANRDFTYMLNELPVLRKNYNKQDNSIDKVKLNMDVIQSMKRTFKDLEFAHVFDYKIHKDVIVSNVWLQFKTDATLQIKRWRSQLVERNETKDAVVLPPALLLSPGELEKATDEVLKLCSTPVKQAACGQGADCKDDVGCFCKDGFRTIDPTIRELGNKKMIMRCEDIDECKEGTHVCTKNSVCVNTLGDYFCNCKAGYKKMKGEVDAMDKTDCTSLCDPNPCKKGSCNVTRDYRVDCLCEPGHSGSLCNRPDVYLQKAQHSTTVVGAVLGTFLAVIIVLIIVYVVRQRKNSYSEDFTPAPRLDNAEMSERRPMRGVSNRAFQ